MKRYTKKPVTVEAIQQMAIIEAGQVEMEEVFFPYLTDGRGRTVYQLYQGGQLAIGDGTED